MIASALVTGATDGIGKQTAKALISKGFQVFVHGRTLAKAEAACAEIGGGEPAFGDLSRLSEVRGLAERMLRATPTLDVLVNNAGVFVHERSTTEDGFELTMAVNHFAPFVLTHALLPALDAARAARCVHVSSVAHQRGTIDPDDLDAAKGFDGYGAYARSKLANVLFSSAIARRTKTTHNALHPGVITTKLLRSGFGMNGASVETGQKTSVRVATDPSLEGVTGKYFSDEREVTPSKLARDVELAERLYAVSCARTGVTPLPLRG